MQTAQSEEVIASFRRPPIVEVVASVRFAGMSDMSVFSLGDFWAAELKPEFGAVSLQAPYEAPVEVGEAQLRAPGVGFSVASSPPVPRLWFASSSGQELLQLQANWFAVNWRQVQDGVTSYDRWPKRRASFEHYWPRFRAWAARRGDSLTIEQCEITYINHIRPIEGVWDSHGSAGQIFRGLSGPELRSVTEEQFSWQAQYAIPAAGGLPFRRLHVSVQPAFTGAPPAVTPVVVLQITVRGGPIGQTDSDITATLDRGREIVVRSFLELTSEEARKSWGQE